MIFDQYTKIYLSGILGLPSDFFNIWSLKKLNDATSSELPDQLLVNGFLYANIGAIAVILVLVGSSLLDYYETLAPGLEKTDANPNGIYSWDYVLNQLFVMGT